MESADSDRQACASLTYQVSLISDRLKTVEYLTKVEGEKPQVFEDIENRFADLTARITEVDGKLF